MVKSPESKKMMLSQYFCSDQVLRDAEFECIGILSNTPDKRMLTYVENEKYIRALRGNKNVCAVICTKDIADTILHENIGIAVADNPKKCIVNIHNSLASDERYIGKSFDTIIGRNCKISSLAVIAEKNVMIGDNAIIEEFVSIKERTQIGNNCVIRTGTVIGGAGFEFKRTEGEIIPITHCGKVLIGNNVEIQQLCNVSKAVYPWDATCIGDYTKLDSFVHVAHASKIGKRTMLASGANVAGSCEIGDDVWIGVNATISSQIKIGHSARVTLGAVVADNVKPGTTVTGNFAIEHSKFLMNLCNQLRTK